MKTWGGRGVGIRPKQFLFFSADVVGSTQLKQTTILDAEDQPVNDEEQTHWFDMIQSFYIRITELVLASYDQTYDDLCRGEKCPAYVSTMKPPRMWKTIGDEVLFWVEVTDSRQVEQYIGIWIAAIHALRTEFRKNPRNKNLDWKCTSWMAHFPWRNKVLFSYVGEVSKTQSKHLVKTYSFLLNQHFAKDEPPAGTVFDFVGPGIDLGFRLTSMSDARRFTISADIAYVLARTALATSGDGPKEKPAMVVPARTIGSIGSGRRKSSIDHHIHFDGLKPLKGVHGGQDYPSFWIDMMSMNRIEDYGRDLELRPPCTAERVLEFADTFYEDRRRYVYRPFIVSDTEEILTERPDWYDERHLAMVRKDGFVA